MPPATRRDFLTRAAAWSSIGAAALVGCAPLAGTKVAQGAAGNLGSNPKRDEIPPALRDAFLDAVAHGREGEVREALRSHSELAAATHSDGRSALVLAASGGHGAVVTALLEHEPPIDLIEAVMIPDWEKAQALWTADPTCLETWHPVGGTALYAGALAGHGSLYQLQSAGAHADGNPLGRNGVTPAYGAVHCASPRRALCSSVELLSNGAHVNAPQRAGDTLLHAAARRGELPIVRYLMRRGADLSARDARGRNPLQMAEAHGHAEVADLLRHPERVPRDDMSTRYAWDVDGGDVQWPDLSDLGREEHGAVTSPAHFDHSTLRSLVDPDPRRAFCRSTQDELAVEACGHTGFRDNINYLLDHGAPMSLCTAISVGRLDRAATILKQHPNAIHERGPHDFAPMLYPAIGQGSIEAAQLLLDHGAPIDQDTLGSTGLWEAAQRGQIDLAAFLIEKGADLHVVGYKVDRAGLSLLQAAELRGKDEMVRFLKDRGAT